MPFPKLHPTTSSALPSTVLSRAAHSNTVLSSAALSSTSLSSTALASTDLSGKTLSGTGSGTSCWRVTSLIDPDGTGHDLAFTDGLAAFGQPELLLWARPTTGSDPGADWLLTHRERCHLLDRWALELIAGRLRPNAEREERFDGGHTVARFRLGRPLSASRLRLPYLPATTQVINVAWSLRRRIGTEPGPSSLRPAVIHRMDRWIAGTEATILGWQLRLGASEPTDLSAHFTEEVVPGPNPTRGARFGPLTRWVNARARQVLQADSEVIAAFLSRLHLAGRVRCEERLLEELSRVATRSSRNSAARQASRTAQELAIAVAGPPHEPTSVWRRALAGLPLAQEPVFPGLSGVGSDRMQLLADRIPLLDPLLRTALTDGLEVLLLAATLADLTPGSLTASATGPWAWAVNDQQVPGRQWLARASARQAGRELLAAATPDVLAEAAHRARLAGTAAAQDPTNLLVAGLQTTAAAAAHTGSLLRRDQRRGLPRSVTRTADQLAGQLVTALALPHRFPAESWATLRQALLPLAPHLPSSPPGEIP